MNMFVLLLAGLIPLSGAGTIGPPPSDPVTALLAGMQKGQYKRLDSTTPAGNYLLAMTPKDMAHYDGATNDPWSTDADVYNQCQGGTIDGVLAYSVPVLSPDGLTAYSTGGGHGGSCRNDIMTFDVMAAAATCTSSTPCTGSWAVARPAGAMLQTSDTHCPPSSSNPCPPPGSYQTSTGPDAAGWDGWAMPSNLSGIGSINGQQGLPSCHTYMSTFATATKFVASGLFCNLNLHSTPHAAEIFDRASRTSKLCHSTQLRADGNDVTESGFMVGNFNNGFGSIAYDDHDGTILNLAESALVFNGDIELDTWDASWPTCPSSVFNGTPLVSRFATGSAPLAPCCNSSMAQIQYFQDVVTPSQGNIFTHVCTGDVTACPHGNYIVLTNVDSGGTVGYINSSYSGTACQNMVGRNDFVGYAEDRVHGLIFRFGGDGHVWKIDLHSGTNYSNMTCADLEVSYSGDVPVPFTGLAVGLFIRYMPKYGAFVVGGLDETNSTYGIWLLNP